jgi:hypothetical protein
VIATWPGSGVHFLETVKIPRYQDFEVTYMSKNRFAYLGNGFTAQEENDEDLTGYLKAIPTEDLISPSGVGIYNYHALPSVST